MADPDHPGARHDRLITELLDIAATVPKVTIQHLKNHDISHISKTADGWHFTQEAKPLIGTILRTMGCKVRHPPPYS